MNKTFFIFLIIPIISISSIRCNIYTNENCRFTENLTKLQMKNRNIYRAYLLADKDNILISDNVDKVLPLASLTKMMTAIVVMDNIKDLNEKFLVDEKEAKIPYGVRLKKGESYTVEQLLKIMLIKSSNSAAQTLANNISDDFSKLMNEKAKELGLKNTKYYTPHGLPPKYTDSEMDVSTARDIYKLSKYLIENYPLLREIVGTKKEIVSNHKLINTNNLLQINKNVKGIKTGFHNQSKYNISIYYEDDENTFFEIILGNENINQRIDITKAVLQEIKEAK